MTQSWRGELARREAAAVEEAEGLRRRITELAGQLQACEQRLSRLVITRETLAEIDAEAGPGDPGPESEVAALHPVSGSASPIGAVVVPQREPGMDPAVVLPGDYLDILEVLADAGEGGLRAGKVAAGLGVPVEDRSKVEGVRAKLKRLAARGWADQQATGLFTVAR
ncbi:hypothetical protein [Nocardia sp. alder85J]|uniref:hypothetical protein n=1 Tax=Nocardia sp. alder85J TaxID=2862949 RepID=UPI001CD2B6B2|nr:hypothetical protein [Nocardia sp. alder85J]MCX4094498.1 hypothetical protein [Nocardia sp. alder85J]MCX4094541.1 hypothetical protein [Nocardia sp. alder85J]MCX4098410.1 hypothetical protein [Nocardia sp. alder85J]